MTDLNEYLKASFEKLPLSHQTFVPTSTTEKMSGAKRSGKNLNTKYRLRYLDFHPFYKPVSVFFK